MGKYKKKLNFSSVNDVTTVTTVTNHPVYAINGNFIKLLLQHKDLGVTF